LAFFTRPVAGEIAPGWARLALEPGDEVDDRLDVFLVGAGRRRHAQALALDAAFVEHQPLDFRAAEIDADSHCISSQKTRADVERALDADRVERLGEP
jgi:hypothetical protein